MPACVTARTCSSPFLPGIRHRLLVAGEQPLERLLCLQCRILRRHRLGAIEREGKLEIERLFGPQRAVIVECRDALLGRHEVRPALRGHARDKVGDGFFRCAVVPGRKRVVLRERRAGRMAAK